MPPLRFMTLTNTMVQFQDHKGVTKTLLAADIPPNFDTPAKAENYINTVWIPANVTDYQMQVHIFSLSPFSVTMGTWNLGTPIPPNWWDYKPQP